MGKVGRRSSRSPLVFFMQACRTELRRRYPQVAVRCDALSRACAVRWESTSAQERAVFEHLAQGWRGAFKTKPIRDPLAPKRPLSAFFLFSSEQRPHVRSRWPGLNYAETAKRLGEQWAALSPEQRQPFEARAVVLRQSYRSALAAYQSRGAGGGEPALLGGKGIIKEEPQQGGEEDPKEHRAESSSRIEGSPRELKEEEPDTLALAGALEGHNWEMAPKVEVEGSSWGTLPKAQNEGHSWVTVEDSVGYSWGKMPKKGGEGPSWGTIPKVDPQDIEGYPLLGIPLEELKEEEREQKVEGKGPHLWVRSGGQLSRKT